MRGRSNDGQVVRWTSGKHQVNVRWTSSHLSLTLVDVKLVALTINWSVSSFPLHSVDCCRLQMISAPKAPRPIIYRVWAPWLTALLWTHVPPSWTTPMRPSIRPYPVDLTRKERSWKFAALQALSRNQRFVYMSYWHIVAKKTKASGIVTWFHSALVYQTYSRQSFSAALVLCLAISQPPLSNLNWQAQLFTKIL